MKGQVEEARDITLQQIITLTKILLLPNHQDSQHAKHLLKLLKKKVNHLRGIHISLCHEKIRTCWMWLRLKLASQALI